jgi:hypothetical protein
MVAFARWIAEACAKFTLIEHPSAPRPREKGGKTSFSIIRHDFAHLSGSKKRKRPSKQWRKL